MPEGEFAVEVIADYRCRLCDGKMGNYAKRLDWREGRLCIFLFGLR